MEAIKKYLSFKLPLSKAGVVFFAAFLFLGIFSPVRFADADFLGIGKALDFVATQLIALLFFMSPIGWIVLGFILIGGVLAFVPVAIGALLLNFVISDKFIFLPYTSGGIVDIGWNITRDIANLLFVAILIVIALRTMLGNEQGGIRLLPKLIGIILIVNFTKVIAGIVVDFANIITNYFLEPIANVGWMIFNLFMLGSPISDIILGGIKILKSISINPLSWGPILDYIQANFGISAIVGDIIQVSALWIVSILLFLTLLVFSLIFMIRYVAIWLLVIVSPLAFAAMILPDTAGFARKWWSSFIKWSFLGVGPAFILFLMAKIIEVRNADPTLFGGFSPSQGIVATEGGMVQQILSPIYTMISEWTFWFVIIVMMVMGLLASLQLQDKSARFIIKNSRKVLKGAGGWVATKTAERYGQKAQEIGTKVSTSGPARIPIFGGIVRNAGDRIAAFRAYGEKEWEKEKKRALSMSTSHNFKTAMVSDDPDEFKGKIMAELEKDPEEVWSWLNRNDATGTSDQKKEKFEKMIRYMSKTGRHREFLWYFPEFAGSSGLKPDLNDPYDSKVWGTDGTLTGNGTPESDIIQREYAARFAQITPAMRAKYGYRFRKITDPAQRDEAIRAAAIRDAKLTRIYAKHIKGERKKYIAGIANQDVLQGIEDNEFITTGEILDSETKLKSYEDTLTKKYTDEARASGTPITPDQLKEKVAREYARVLRPESMKHIPEGKLRTDPAFLNALAETKRKLDYRSLEAIKDRQGDQDFERLLERVADKNPDEFLRLGDSQRIFEELMSRDMQRKYWALGGKKHNPPPPPPPQPPNPTPASPRPPTPRPGGPFAPGGRRRPTPPPGTPPPTPPPAPTPTPNQPSPSGAGAGGKKAPETIPTREGVRSVFEQLVEGGAYNDIRAMEDEDGLYLWDIKAGENTEYTYMRKGRYKQGSASDTKIYVTYFDNGIPIGGDEVARYVDGKWDWFIKGGVGRGGAVAAATPTPNTPPSTTSEEERFLDIINPQKQNPPQPANTAGAAGESASNAGHHPAPQELDLGGGVKILDMFEKAGRRVFVVQMPDGTVRPFYRSTGTGEPGRKLEGDINPFGGWLEKRHRYTGMPEGWFIKGGVGIGDDLAFVEEGKEKRLRPANQKLREVADQIKQYESRWEKQNVDRVDSHKEANERLRKYKAILRENTINSYDLPK